MMLDAALKAKGIESTVFTTEAANAINESGIAIAFFHANLPLRPARFHIRVHHESDADAQPYDAHVFLYENARLRAGVPGNAVWIPPASDIESIAQQREPATKQSMGPESASSIATPSGP